MSTTPAVSVDDKAVVTEPELLSPMSMRVVVATVCGLLGVGLSWVAMLLADLAVSLRWVPFGGLWKLLTSIPPTAVTVAAVLISAGVGVSMALGAEAQRLSVTVSRGSVTLQRGKRGEPREIHRAAIGGVFLDGRYLVLLGKGTEELAREDSDLEAKDLQEAFTRHGYPWHGDGDPHAGEYQRYIEGAPELPPGADALLQARKDAVAVGDREKVARILRELARVGVAVRDERKQQFWRPTGGGADPRR